MNGVQMQLARFILGFHSRSLMTLTPGEVGLIPIPLRRLHLTARYFRYAAQNRSHPAFAALENSLALAITASNANSPLKKRGWFFHFANAISEFGSFDPTDPNVPWSLLEHMVQSDNGGSTSCILTSSKLTIFLDSTLSVFKQSPPEYRSLRCLPLLLHPLP